MYESAWLVYMQFLHRNIIFVADASKARKALVKRGSDRLLGSEFFHLQEG